MMKNTFYDKDKSTAFDFDSLMQQNHANVVQPADFIVHWICCTHNLYMYIYVCVYVCAYTRHTMILIQNMNQFIEGFIRLIQSIFLILLIHSEKELKRVVCSGIVLRSAVCLRASRDNNVILGYIASHSTKPANSQSQLRYRKFIFCCGAGDSLPHSTAERGKTRNNAF